MNNISPSKIFYISRTEYLRWLLNPRIIIFFIVWVFINNCALAPLAECVAETGKNLCIFEPFIAVGNSPFLLLIMPLGYMTVMGDFPREDKSAMFYLHRCGRLNWIFGQLLMSLYAALTYIAAVFLGSTLPLASKCFIGDNWSDGVRYYRELFPEKIGSAVTSLLPGNLYNQFTPGKAAAATFGLMLLFFLWTACVMLLFRVAKLKKAGFLTVCAATALGASLTASNSTLMWLTPLGNTVVWKHFTEYLREPVFPLWASYLYFAVFILALTAAAALISRKSNFESTVEED